MATHPSIFAWRNMDRGSWWAAVREVTKELDTTEQLTLRFFLYLLFITFPLPTPLLPSLPPFLFLSFLLILNYYNKQADGIVAE